MSWWPFSSSSGSDESPATSSASPLPPQPEAPKRDFSLTEQQRQRIFGRGAPQSSPFPDPVGRDPEFDAFLREFGVDPTGSSASATSNDALHPQTTPAAPPAPLTDTTGRRVNPDGTLDISPAALYPRTMSCRTAFDAAFYCQSAGGKFNDIYRYGSLQPCSEHWGAFWFCMRIRTYKESDKQELIADYYRKREERRKERFGSSENVWEIRTKGVDTAFGEKYDEAEGIMGGK
ncbi:hypothetical protein B0A48_17929 [Cryoendolithus antarcticus]|uniref:Early meiotic induction protein 1 n=1 Tax=Cryoendolithus antarcticus TaxID=1507870 RepID=A0A1V8SA17_9PEZI|nr:hypothetical protein B0A48_17929 [Cryoendolithus antarcticus]